MIGLDTGFFLKFLEGETRAIELWQRVMEGEEAAVSCITLFELRRLSLRGQIPPDALHVMIEAITSLSRVAWLDDYQILIHAAHLSHDAGIPALDALVLAGLLKEGALKIWTTDSHLEGYKKRGIKIMNLTRGMK